MEQNQETIFVGSAKQKHENILALSIDLDALKAFLASVKGKEGHPSIIKGKKATYLKLTAIRKKEANDWSTHFIKVDDYVAPPKDENPPKKYDAVEDSMLSNDLGDDLPF
jgi:hypothetical protein